VGRPWRRCAGTICQPFTHPPAHRVELTEHAGQTDHQADPSALIRYALGLPVSTAVIGVANPAQLMANAAATHASPMDPTARRELERLLA